jgi:rSAM/selenodomain-associated transferase 1
VETVLAVMARFPRRGAVKTRLARTVGEKRAVDLYRAFLLDIDARFGRGPRRLVWLYDPPHADWSSVVGPAAWSMPQAGKSLGARMHNCFSSLCGTALPGIAADADARGLPESTVDRVLMIGADVPHVADAHLAEAEERLSEVDVVLGPSDDGGYYLVAMRQAHDIFTGVAMGTAQVLEQTLARISAANLRVHLLPRGFDIDEGDDLERLWRVLASDPQVRLPHTAALLERWRPVAGARRHPPRARRARS